jgi:hypothetical protein
MSNNDCEHFYTLPPPRKGRPYTIDECKFCGERQRHNNARDERTPFGRKESHLLRKDAISVLKNP